MSQMRKTQATSSTGTGEKTLRVFSEFVLDYKMSGLFVRYPRVYTHKHIPPNIPPYAHIHTGDSSGGVRFVICLASSHQCWMSTLFSLLYLENVGGMMRGTKTPNNKKGPQQCRYLRGIYCCLCLPHLTLLFLSFFVPPPPPFHIHTPS